MPPPIIESWARRRSRYATKAHNPMTRLKIRTLRDAGLSDDVTSVVKVGYQAYLPENDSA